MYCIMEADPLSVILVKSDSKGDRLLFRFPYATIEKQENGRLQRRKNPYALTITESIQGGPPIQKLNKNNGYLANFPDEVLSNLFAVKQELCEAKFELKVNNVRFVGHPSLVPPCIKRNKTSNKQIILLNIVFALEASASHSIVKCYYELSKKLGSALKLEEKRCGYVNSQMKIMISAHDDCGRSDESESDALDPYEMILEQSSLASDLKNIYNDLCTHGLVQIRINRTIPMSFCLPQKVHHLQNPGLMVDPETIEKCLKKIRPYHGLLLLVEPSRFLETLNTDNSSDLFKLVKMYTPLKSLHTLAVDANLKLPMVFKLAGHLVYWGKAMIIYPLCENNVYTTAPNASVHTDSQLVQRFSKQFPSYSLLEVLSEFSLPISVSQRMSPFSDSTHNDVQIIIWLLQHRLLLQLHTYVYYMPSSRGMTVQGIEESDSSEGDSETDTSDENLSKNVNNVDDLLGKIDNDVETANILSVPSNALEKKLFLRLIQQGYLKGEHHLEEIMYSENISRSQLLQLLDKFREVLVICEAEDSALAMFYPH